MSRLNFRLLLLVLSGFLGACATGRGPSETGTKDTSKSFSTIVVDAGHGGKDNGAYRKFGGAEKIATLDVAKRLSRKLRESDLEIVMTRRENRDSRCGQTSFPQAARIRFGNRDDALDRRFYSTR